MDTNFYIFLLNQLSVHYYLSYNFSGIFCLDHLLKKKCYPWAKNENLKSRIDRFYCEKHLVKNCEYKNICETSMSDHRNKECVEYIIMGDLKTLN